MKARTNAAIRINAVASSALRFAVFSLALLVSGCGGGGGSSPAPAKGVSSDTTQQTNAVNSFAITSDDYGVGRATYLAATKSTASIVLRAAVATGETDPNFRTLTRIDIFNPQAVTAGGVYSLGAATAGTPFAGDLYVFNGHQSTLLRTIGGTVSFTTFGATDGDRISGSFSAIVEDGNDTSFPKANYTIAGNFEFVLATAGPVLPAVASVSPAIIERYGANCASCHALGSLDSTAGTAPELSLKGGKMNGRFVPDVPGHQGIKLAATDIDQMKVLLNMN